MRRAIRLRAMIERARGDACALFFTLAMSQAALVERNGDHDRHDIISSTLLAPATRLPLTPCVVDMRSDSAMMARARLCCARTVAEQSVFVRAPRYE